MVKHSLRATVRYWNAHLWPKSVFLVGVLAVLLWRADLASVADSFAHVDVRWLLAAAAVDVAVIFLKGIDIKIAFDSLRLGRVRVLEAFSSTSIGLMINWLVPARLGEFARAYVMQRSLRRRELDVPVATIFGSVLAERLFAVASIIVLLLVAMIRGGGLPSWARTTFYVGAPVIVAIAVALVVYQRWRQRNLEQLDARYGAIARPGDGGAAAGAGPRRGTWARITHQAHALGESAHIMGRPGYAAVEFLAQALTWVVQLVVYYFVLRAFHLGNAGLDAAALVMVLTNLIGLVPFTPGNWGTFQAAAVGALALQGVGRDEALAYALGIQGLQTMVGMTLGFVFLSREHLSLREVEAASLRAEEGLLDEDEPEG